MRTLEIGSNSPYKTVWWKVDLGGVYSIYSINVLFKNYDDWDGCKRSDVFGIDCDNPCPANCICMIENGSCLKCKTGWSGTFCDIECMESWYNVNSSQKCVGHCRENSTCNQVTGQCESDAQLGGQEHYVRKLANLGITAGWVGHNCSIECTQSYGENCQYSCSLYCINQTCDRFNRNCLCDDKHESLQNIETLNGPSCTLWIVFFSISMAIHIIFISVTLIGRRYGKHL
uniref:Uncharacterized protein n=1 Tax=Magallana gigas TaxID=29159 RepID=A0A8W8P1M3_MAGGI